MLDPIRAAEENNCLISRGLVLVYMARGEDMDDFEVASIAGTRRGWRQLQKSAPGVNGVGRDVLSAFLQRVSIAFLRHKLWLMNRYLDRGKEMVALYVGTTNRTRLVYADASFVGLGNNDAHVEGVDNWVEIGCDRSQIDLGHY